jgi:cell division protease FtsH
LRILCAGRIAEELFRNDVKSGVVSDIRQATQIARTMVTRFGMNDSLGFVYYGDDENDAYFGLPQRTYSDDTARAIDAEVKRLIDEAYTDARRMIIDNKAKLERLAQALLKHETLEGEEVIAIMRGEEIRRPTIGDLLDEDRSAPLKEPARGKPEIKPPPLGGALPQPG